MSRKSIFELLAIRNNIGRDASRLKSLYEDYYIVSKEGDAPKSYCLLEFVSQFCFYKWKNKGRCLDTQDYLDTLGFDSILNQAIVKQNLDSFLTVIEVIYNFWYLLTRFVDNNQDRFDYYNAVNILKDLMDECLSEYNQKAFYFEETEQCVIAEDSPQVTAAAEATDTETGMQIVRYNHRQMAGDIAGKRMVLIQLLDYLEGRNKEIRQINNTLYDEITNVANNFNIRHNNVDSRNKSRFRQKVADMPDSELEKAYDDLYQMILLAILEIDNKARRQEMKKLVQTVNQTEG